ncbi:MAG: glycosyltransferase [Candidatus Chisholmbacteria bacterium]|nr:glycosyltransferase [Candidatus Chisholmbacteria bacterium]
MRIFFASQSFYPSIGGVSTYLYNLARELQSSGNEVSEIHLRSPGEEGAEALEGINIFRVPKEPLDRELLKGYYQFKELIYNESHRNLGLIDRPLEQMPGYAEFVKLNDIFGTQIGELLEYHKGEIVHVHDFQLLLLYKYIPRGIPLVFTWHIPLAKNISKDLARFLVEHMSQFDATIFSSPQYIKTAIHHGLPKAKAKLIYPICNTDLFTKKRINKIKVRRHHGLPPKAKIILCVQRIDAKSGHEPLIRAFARVREKIKNAHLVFVGGKSMSNLLSQERRRYERHIFKLIAALNLKKSITFTGSIPYESLPFVYNSVDVYALLSYNEGFGLSVTEAMACGLPIVGRRVGGIPEQIAHQKNGFLVPEDDDGTIAARYLTRLLKDRNLRAIMGKESLRLVERKFKMRFSVEKHLSLYTALKLAKHGPTLPERQNISAIITDFDHTVTDSPGQLNVDILRSLRRVSKNLILVTGRPIVYVKKLTRRFGGWVCIVAENGAVIYFPKSGQTITFNSRFMRSARLKAKNAPFPVKRGRVILSVQGHKARSLRSLVGPGTLRHLQEHTNMSERMLLPRSVNKARSLRIALDILHLNPEEIIIIGDGENDLDLFHLPGTKIAVANAHPALKKLADHVTTSAATEGIKEIIKLLSS